VTTVADALHQGQLHLANGGLDCARLQARQLLAYLLGASASEIYQRLADPLVPEQLARYDALIGRRAEREPLAYLIGSVEFFGRSFVVDRRVLVPRPETEELLELALSEVHRLDRRGRVRSVVDVGTGSGVLALSLASELPDVWAVGTDRSADAIAVAKLNRRRLHLENRVDFVRCDLLSGLGLAADLIVANLPYVPSAEIATLQPEVQREPRIALDGGPDGFALYRRLLTDVSRHLAADGVLIAEIGAYQRAEALRLGQLALPRGRSRVTADLAGRDRFLVVRRARDASEPAAFQADWLEWRLA
jgi:release factor glutamine methyltransferase